MQPNIRYSEPLTGARGKAARILESGGTISDAARAAGVSRPTIYAWMKRDTDFRRSLKESAAASELNRKTETNILARLAFGAIAQILSNDELPAGVRARVALAVLERGNVDSSPWGTPDPVLELDAALPKPAVAALTAEARKLYNFTPQLDTGLTAPPLPVKDLPQKIDVKPEDNILYTAA